MEFKINSIQIKDQAIKPGLLIDVNLEFYENAQLPFLIEGVLISENHKDLATIKEYSSFPNDLVSLSSKDQSDNKKRNRKILLHSELNEYTIDYIESTRHSNNSKDVIFIVKLKVKYFSTTFNSKNSTHQFSLLTYDEKVMQESYSIPQSDWVKNYAKGLEIGNYVLLEFNHDSITNLEEYFGSQENLRNKLIQAKSILADMKSNLVKGEWHLVLTYSRSFFELFKLGKNNSIEPELKRLYKIRNGSELGFEDFYKAIFHMFQFISKFNHELDKSDNLQVKPKAQAEDAYFTYSTCLNAFYIIKKKT